MTENRIRPNFVIFDYGETLAHEADFRPEKGFAALLKFAVQNPQGADADELLRAYADCFQALRLRAMEAGVEIPNQRRLRWLFEMYDLEFSLSPEALERVYWDATAPCEPTPNMPELLRRIRACGVGTGVVSNMGFSGETLRDRLEGLFPEHRFDFVISSADYIPRKPDRHLFALALKKAKHPAKDVWFLGDNPAADVLGAAGAGMTAVFYDRDLGCAYRELDEVKDLPPCLRVHDWSDLYPFFDA